jgi:hypothetical protein
MPPDQVYPPLNQINRNNSLLHQLCSFWPQNRVTTSSYAQKKPPFSNQLTLAAFGSVDIFKEADPIQTLHGIAILINSHTPFRFPSQSGKALERQE